jgi:hypothetical protein
MAKPYTERDLAYLRAFGGIGVWHMASDLGRSESAIKAVCLKHKIPLGGVLSGYRNKYVLGDFVYAGEVDDFDPFDCEEQC